MGLIERAVLFFLMLLKLLFLGGFGFGGVVGRLNLPPKLFSKIWCFVAHTLKVIEILCGDGHHQPRYARDTHGRIPVAYAARVKPLGKIFHQLPALGCFILSRSF